MPEGLRVYWLPNHAYRRVTRRCGRYRVEHEGIQVRPMQDNSEQGRRDTFNDLQRGHEEVGFSPDAPTFNSGVVGEEDRPSGVGTQGSGAYLQLLDEMSKMHLAKNAGYGSKHDAWSNFRSSEGWGVPAYIGCLIRMSDKYQRMQNLIADPSNDQVGESIIDTAMDLAAYALIFVCLWQEELIRQGIYRGAA